MYHKFIKMTSTLKWSTQTLQQSSHMSLNILKMAANIRHITRIFEGSRRHFRTGGFIIGDSFAQFAGS